MIGMTRNRQDESDSEKLQRQRKVDIETLPVTINLLVTKLNLLVGEKEAKKLIKKEYKRAYLSPKKR